MAGLKVDRDTANWQVRLWLKEVANQRLHATTRAIPFVRLEEEGCYLQPLPFPYQGKIVRSVPESEGLMEKYEYKPLQHPLEVYQEVLEGL